MATVEQKYQSVDGDFFTVEFISNFLDFANGNASVIGGSGIHSPDVASVLALLMDLKAKGLKGCVLNTPDITELEIMSQIKDLSFFYSQMRSLNSSFSLSKDSFTSGEYLLTPTAGNYSLASRKINVALKKASQGNIFLRKDVKRMVEDHNKNMEEYAYKTGFPVVDIKGLYKKVLSGSFVTHDGIRVSPDYENGNFFSSDGAYPSAFGIISNEIIRTMSKWYNTKIELIETRMLLQY